MLKMARKAVHGGGADRKVWDVAINSDVHSSSALPDCSRRDYVDACLNRKGRLAFGRRKTYERDFCLGSMVSETR